jgi:hypothetical protein
LWDVSSDCGAGTIIIDAATSTIGSDEATCCRALMCSEVDVCSADSVLIDAADTTPTGMVPTDVCCIAFAVHQVTLAGSAEDVAASGGEEAFIGEFQTSIAEMLDGVSADVVTVTSLTYGSIIIDFFIASTSASEDATVSTLLEEQLADSPAIEVAGIGVSAFTTTRPVAAASASASGPQNSAAGAGGQEIAGDGDEGGGSGLIVAVLLLVVVGGICGFGFMQHKKKAEDEDKQERSENIENPMNAAGGGGGGGGGGGNAVWKEVVDKNSGKTYYVNRQTKATTWDRPPELDAAGGGGGGGGGNAVWKEVVDKNSGKTYYVNRQTKAPTWDRPPELDGGLEVERMEV